MDINTHKDLLNEIEKKELEKYIKIKKDIEDIEKRLMPKTQKVSKKELEETIGQKGQLRKVIDQKVQKMEEIAPNLEEIKNNKEKEQKLKNPSNDVKKYINQLNELVKLEENDISNYEKIVNHLEEKYFELEYKLKSQLHINKKLKNKVEKVEILDATKEKEFLMSNSELKESIIDLTHKSLSNKNILSLKNNELMSKLENFINEKKQIEEEKEELIGKLERKEDIIIELKRKIENENRKVEQHKDSVNKTKSMSNSLIYQVESNLNEIESLKTELDTELETHEKTMELNGLLKKENELLKEKIVDLKSHIVNLSDGFLRAVKESEQKDVYYPAMFESSKIAEEEKQELNKLKIRIDSLELSEQLKLNEIKKLNHDIDELKTALNQEDHSSIYDQIIEKTLSK